MIKSKEPKTKISHAHSLILSLFPQSVVAGIYELKSVAADGGLLTAHQKVDGKSGELDALWELDQIGDTALTRITNLENDQALGGAKKRGAASEISPRSPKACSPAVNSLSLLLGLPKHARISRSPASSLFQWLAKTTCT